jgi:hypothetical protein
MQSLEIFVLWLTKFHGGRSHEQATIVLERVILAEYRFIAAQFRRNDRLKQFSEKNAHGDAVGV